MRRLAEFKDAHRGEALLVCGCGSSLNQLERPDQFVTIGVNDVGRSFDPNYLVVVDPREQFKGDRFHYVETSRAGYLFTQRTDLGLSHPNTVQFRLGQKDGTDLSDPDVLHYSVTTPYVALCLAIHMGAADIGLIGVDFTDHHFFGETGPHGWAPHVATIDAQFDRLGRAAFARGVRVFNLSERSRLSCLPKMSLEAFATLARSGRNDAGRQRSPPSPPLSIVSYATTPLVGVPAILARCINARTRHRARCVWAGGTYDTGISCEGDLDWRASPSRAMEELEAADVVIAHNGRIDDRHRAVLADKPVVTMAHNERSNVDDRFARQGFPALVVGQYQATLPEFATAGWSVVPNPMPLWEEACRPGVKTNEVSVAYTPASRRETYPPGHPLFWHGKGFATTLRALDRLAGRHPIRLELPREAFVSHAEAMAMKRRAHIVIDECVTGSYHRNSLEGLAAGCVVVNGVGLLPGVLETLRHCAGADAPNPFVGADLSNLEDTLDTLIGLGPGLLGMLGASNRTWIERHWDFGRQWDRFWQPAIDDALQVAQAKRSARPRRARSATAAASSAIPSVSVVVVSLNEGEFLRRTVESLRAGLPEDGEIIVVDDGSTDGSADFLTEGGGVGDAATLVRSPLRLGSAKARNFGAGHARGQILVFSDAHVAAAPGWAAPLAAALADPDVGAAAPGTRVMQFPDDYDPDRFGTSAAARGFGMKWSGPGLGIAWLGRKQAEPFPAPLLGGAFLAMRRNLFAAVGGFDPGLEVWGSEDAELSIRLWMLGYRCMAVPQLEVAHHFRTKRPYRVDWEPVLYNKLRLASLHFGEHRRRRVIDTLGANPALAAAQARLDASDVLDRRHRLHALRRYDDDWFFERFSDEPMPGLSELEPARFQ